MHFNNLFIILISSFIIFGINSEEDPLYPIDPLPIDPKLRPPIKLPPIRFPPIRFPPFCPNCDYETIVCNHDPIPIDSTIDTKITTTLRIFPCPLIYFPVCGYFENCNSDGVRHQEYSNGCWACRDPNVLYYETRHCPGNIYPPISASIKCRASDRLGLSKHCPTCTTPVCGYYKICDKNKKCYEEFPNGCHACLNTQISTYIQGPCPLLPD